MKPLDVYLANENNPKSEMFPYCKFLRRKAKGRILEIGVDTGISTAAFLLGVEERGGHVYSVDVNAGCGKLYAGHPQWTFICSDSRDTEKIKGIVDEVDVLLIDGYHEHPIVDSDLNNYAPLVRSGGCIIMHDIRMQDVCEAYHKFIVEKEYVHFELSGLSESRDSNGMAWGLGIIYVR